MLGRFLAFLGAVLVVLGILKLVGILAIGTASAVALIVIGLICWFAAEFVFGGVWLNRRGRV